MKDKRISRVVKKLIERKERNGFVQKMIMWFLLNFVHGECHKNGNWERRVVLEFGVKQHKMNDEHREFWVVPILAECSKCGVQFITENRYDWDMIKRKIDKNKIEPDILKNYDHSPPYSTW